ncbi:Nn.00g079540.m01.CDS01 [Neocucurbitaria sp. VM-36]
MARPSKKGKAMKAEQHHSHDQPPSHAFSLLQASDSSSNSFDELRNVDGLHWFSSYIEGNREGAKDEFLADAYLVSLDDIGHTAQRLRRREVDTSTDGFKDLLDAIALLFARHKPKEKNNSISIQQLNRHHTSQHMSAAATRKLNKRNEYTIYIAKNAGSLELEELADDKAARDDELATFLEKWFNKPGYPEHDKEFSSRLKTFWTLRLRHYQRSIDQTRDSLPKRLATKQDRLRVPHTSDKDEFDLDFKYALDEESTAGDMNNVGLQYPKYLQVCHARKEKAAESYKGIYALADEFRTFIKHTRLLNSIDTMMDIFRGFRRRLRKDGARVKMEGPGHPGTFTANPKAIQDVMQTWVLKPEDGRQLAIDRLQGLGPQSRDFHCELQLMDRFPDDLEIYSYIGCSKRSCWFCWEILLGTRFMTQGTHRTVHWLCAYPLTTGDSYARRALAKRFEEVSTYLKEAGNDIMIGKPDSIYTSGVAQSQTAPLITRLRARGGESLLSLAIPESTSTLELSGGLEYV